VPPRDLDFSGGTKMVVGFDFIVSLRKTYGCRLTDQGGHSPESFRGTPADTMCSERVLTIHESAA